MCCGLIILLKCRNAEAAEKRGGIVDKPIDPCATYVFLILFFKENGSLLASGDRRQSAPPRFCACSVVVFFLHGRDAHATYWRGSRADSPCHKAKTKSAGPL